MKKSLCLGVQRIKKGKKFNAICHFFGYQAREYLPSNFDYAYALGHIAYHLLGAGLNDYMATVINLKKPVFQWQCGDVPITIMMTVKRRLRGDVPLKLKNWLITLLMWI